MGYQHKDKPGFGAAMLTIEQERRKNAEIALTLRQLAFERQNLEATAEKVKGTLTALRSTIDTSRDQTTLIAEYRERLRELPPPVHGGRDGLLAAVKEIDAHDARVRPRKPTKGPSHGTWRRYYQLGCRCETCNAWKQVVSERSHDRYLQQKQRQDAA